MKVLSDPRAFQTLARNWSRKGRSVGFVPTMGALHEGHLTLVRKCRLENDVVAASIFVNPLQFGPKEDFKKYPRMLGRDLALLRKEGVRAVFTPTARLFYPEGSAARVRVSGPMVEGLCGRYRPGHFDGVATVVVKLLEVVRPQRLYLGQKDYQQVAILKRVILDLNLPVKTIMCPTVRESDGLAMSSRNMRLSPEGRRAAAVISRALIGGREAFRRGARKTDRVRSTITRILATESRLKIQYLEAVHPETLAPLRTLRPGSVLALAAFVDGVRLIDNRVL